MLLEIVLYIQQRYAGRVPVGDGEIIAVVENGQRRAPKTTSFRKAVKYIQYETDLQPVGLGEQIGRKSYFTTHKYTYRKGECYVQARYDRWACAYPVGECPDRYWKVRRAGKFPDTRFESEDLAKRDVDAWVGYDYVGDLHQKTIDKSHKTQRAEKDMTDG